jgi:hypothetical protein
VLVVGEGQGGSLAAFFWEKYPHYATYALAISAPVGFAAFSADADAQLLIALGNQTKAYPRHTRWALAELAKHDARRHPGLSAVLFAEFVYKAAQAVMQKLESGTLGAYCRAMVSQDLDVFVSFV